MTAGLPLASYLANPRALMALVLMIGLVASQGGKGTLAYFTQSSSSSNNQFIAGKLTITTNTLLGGTNTVNAANSIPIHWGTKYDTGTSAYKADDGTVANYGTTADCALEPGLTTNLNKDQAFVPGTYCVGLLKVANTGNVDAWMRIRLHRIAATSVTAGGADLLNNQTRFYMYEIASAGDPLTCTTAQWTNLSTPGLANWTVVSRGTGSGAESINGDYIGDNASEASATNELLITANAAIAGTSITAGQTASSYVDLIGSTAVDANTSAGAGVTNALVAAGTTRNFCVAFHLPLGSVPSANNADDNQFQGSLNTYQFSIAMAQKSGRGVTQANP